MAKKVVTAIFDIGKTNKKFFLFDEDYQEVFRNYQRFDEVADEDGHPTDDLPTIRRWAKELFDDILASKQYDVRAINFCTYGASLVHIDKHGQPLTPLYSYTKPLPSQYLDKFYHKHGGAKDISIATGSPAAGMLNSGLQLFWLKESDPQLYKRIKYSLHLPQYMSYLFTGLPVSDYTSLGCHTMLWDYSKGDYHDWVYAEGVDEKLAPVVSTNMSVNMNYMGNGIKVGVGIHDSSAALLPYLKGDSKPFALLSTGTWSVTLNPFSQDSDSSLDAGQDVLYYMRIDGQPVKASRLFLGNEYKLQIEELHVAYDKPYGYHRSVQFDEAIYGQVNQLANPCFRFKSLSNRETAPPATDLSVFRTFEHAYHRLMLELMELQVASSKVAVGQSDIRRFYIDGGFTDNDLFVKLVSYHFSHFKLRTGKSPLGSALGAAIVISDKEISKKFLKKKYGLQKHKPLILDVKNR